MAGSKEGQDVFVQKLLKSPGWFLDIGCNDPESGSNSVRLERKGWTGLLLDRDAHMVEACKQRRSSPAEVFDCKEANRNDWLDLLAKHEMPRTIDYLSLDVDEANVQVVQNFPFELYEFKVMTIETDVYRYGDRIKRPMRAIVDRMPKYFCILDDGMVKNLIWEDWFINTNYLKPRHSGFKKRNWVDMIASINSTPLML